MYEWATSVVLNVNVKWTKLTPQLSIGAVKLFLRVILQLALRILYFVFVFCFTPTHHCNKKGEIFIAIYFNANLNPRQNMYFAMEDFFTFTQLAFLLYNEGV